MSGLPFILKNAPSTKVFILTSHGSIEKAVDAMRRGAAGFLTKGTDPSAIIAELTEQMATSITRKPLALDQESLRVKMVIPPHSSGGNAIVATIISPTLTDMIS